MATPSSCVQLALEETPRGQGAVSTAPYRVATDVIYLPASTVAYGPDPSFVNRGDELRGIEGEVADLIDGFAPKGSLAMRAYANPLTWLLCAAGFQATYTAGNGVITDPDSVVIPAGASRWVFTKRPYTSSSQQARTFQMWLAYVTEGIFAKAQGVGIPTLTLNANGEITAELLGLYYDPDQTDPNLAPVVDASAIPFFRRGDLTLTWLASTGTTDDFSISIANALAANRPLGQASYFPGELNPGDRRVVLTGSMPKYRFAKADIDALMAGTTFAAKARFVSPKVIGATTYKYSMWIEMPACQYTGGGPGDLSNNRRVPASFDFKAAWDEASGYDVKITLVNAVTSIGAPFNATNLNV